MPAKRKKLPQPCPKCGSLYGTVQMVFFNQRRKVKKKYRDMMHGTDDLNLHIDGMEALIMQCLE